MQIVYDTRKDLPCKALHDLFVAVGWSDGIENPAMLKNFNVPFINSTIVFSAWAEDKLVGCVRVLSDRMFRSILYDLAVMPEFQGQGIGKELVRRCRECFPDSEWLVETETAAGFYEKIGFKPNKDIFLSIPCKWF
ncbi:MAG: GNAT family N-acetyltransferase [Eubacteriales bacterium]|nr:GNAT family N-acetyltransferase [Eubacteriales bacterium]